MDGSEASETSKGIKEMTAMALREVPRTSFLELQSPTPLSKEPEKNKGMIGGVGKDGEEHLRRESRERGCHRPGAADPPLLANATAC